MISINRQKLEKFDYSSLKTSSVYKYRYAIQYIIRDSAHASSARINGMWRCFHASM